MWAWGKPCVLGPSWPPAWLISWRCHWNSGWGGLWAQNGAQPRHSCQNSSCHNHTQTPCHLFQLSPMILSNCHPVKGTQKTSQPNICWFGTLWVLDRNFMIWDTLGLWEEFQKYPSLCSKWEHFSLNAFWLKVGTYFSRKKLSAPLESLCFTNIFATASDVILEGILDLPRPGFFLQHASCWWGMLGKSRVDIRAIRRQLQADMM